MIFAAIGFFSLAALIGLYLLSMVWNHRQIPPAVVMIHGSMAALGVALLLFYIFGPGPDPIASLVLFVMAALGGAYMFLRDRAGHKPPLWMALGHGMTAVTGFTFLILNAAGIVSF